MQMGAHCVKQLAFENTMLSKTFSKRVRNYFRVKEIKDSE